MKPTRNFKYAATGITGLVTALLLFSYLANMPLDDVAPIDIDTSKIGDTDNIENVLQQFGLNNAVNTIEAENGNDASNHIVASIDVQFPNGETVDVSLVQWAPRWPSAANSGPLIDQFDNLANDASAGDGAAARHLFRELEICRHTFYDSDSLETAIVELRRTGHLVYPSGRDEHTNPGTYTVSLENSAREIFAKCEGIAAAQIETSEHWLDIAVEANDFLAMRDLAKKIGLEKQEAFDLYRETWLQGHFGSASALAVFYKNAVPSRLNGEADLVTSYAFNLITRQLMLSVSESLGERSARPSMRNSNRLVGMDQVMSNKAAYLTPDQLDEAVDLAAQMLRDNDNCCKGYWVHGQ